MKHTWHGAATLVAMLTISFLASAQSREMTLSQVFAVADSLSPTMRAARAGVMASAEQVQAARAGTELPNVGISGSVGYLGNGYGWNRTGDADPFTVEMPHLSTRLGIEAQQVVYAGGAMRAAVRQAEAGSSMSRIAYRQAQQDLRMQLAGCYLDLYRSVQQMEVLDSNIALAERLVDDIVARRSQGTALKNDQTRYELQLADLRLQRVALQSAIDVAGHRLAVLSGIGDTIRPVADLPVVAVPSLQSADSIPALQMADQAILMAELSEAEARAAQRPTLMLVAQDHLEGPVTIDITPYDINYNYWFVGLALRYDLSAWWKQLHAVRTRQWTAQQRRLERQAVSDAQQVALDEAFSQLDVARQALQTRQQSIRLAEENYALVSERYGNDLALLVDMLDAASARLRAGLDLIEAQINITFCELKINYINGEL